jgi:aminopeptidase N
MVPAHDVFTKYLVLNERLSSGGAGLRSAISEPRRDDRLTVYCTVMSARILASTLALLLIAANGYADTYPRQPGVDAIHYLFRLTLDDSSDRIAGETTVTLRLAERVSEVSLDLTSAAAGKGMTVTAVTIAGKAVAFKHESDRLRIPLHAPAKAGEELQAVVTYGGIPANGLRLINNIHGERSMFSENWPNRARQWLPMIDHPYDKATGEFVVTAPSHYQVVANGLLMEELDLGGGQRRTHWKQSVPIASWLYALGVARFAVHHYDVVRGIPQQVWVFPQDRERGYQVFELTGRRAFEFFSDWVGPYSYEKLAHVQAAGLGGGTEHASAIFYGEKGVASGRAPVVHEVAHQWWGNAVTEKDWDDVWLSEGFATYFTHLYSEQFNGRDAFVRGLRGDVQTILNAQKAAPDQPIIHRNISDMSRVLNRLVYQKGGWVLHMLRGTIGTEKFWAGIRDYYGRYRNQNASTDDFRQVMERASGMELSWFFDQWLKRPGMPELKGGWRYDPAAKQVQVEIAQVQTGAPYRLPLEIAIGAATGAPRIERVELTEANGRFTFAADAEPASVTLDPNTWVLMQTPEFVKR